MSIDFAEPRDFTGKAQSWEELTQEVPGGWKGHPWIHRTSWISAQHRDNWRGSPGRYEHRGQLACRVKFGFPQLEDPDYKFSYTLIKPGRWTTV